MTSTTPKKVRVPDLALMKQRGDRIVMLTAYTMARLLDRAGIDLLVGDSLGNVIMGLETTIPVTLDKWTIPVTLDKWNSRFLGSARSDGKGATFALKSSRTQLARNLLQRNRLKTFR